MACSLIVTLTGVTGDCSNTNSGAFGITINGTAPDYTIDWVSPSLGTFPLGAGVTGYSINSLSAGTYTFYVVDSCPSGNTYSLLNVYISSGSCVSLIDSTNTSCGFDNGSLTAATSNLYFASTYYLYELTSGFISSATTQNTSNTFTSLSAGTYYVIADDGGGCTGKSESCIIKSSSTLNFGLYQINNSACVNSLGSLYVTGLTGTPPYTYSWLPNGETTSSITGLTNGSYSVTVTDGLGCVTSQGAIIGQVPTLGTILLNDVQPTCFSATGQSTIYISGGTAPYHIQGSNGEIVITFATSYTFSGLPAGYFSVTVTDAGLCQSTAYTTLLTPSALSVVTINVDNSNCNNLDGQISVSVFGGAAPYTYTLTDSNNDSQIGIQPLQNAGFIFTSLSSDTYTLTISDSSNLCPYSGSVVVSNNVLYTLTAQTTSSSCNQPTGSVTLGLTTGGTAPYRYQINGYDILNVTGLTYSFTNLFAGNYTAVVTDANLCTQTLPFTITNLGSLDFVLSSTNPSFSNNGEITAFITDGTPPFTLNWSPNVNGQTGLTVSALTAGTYTLTITDFYGCVQTRTTTLIGYNLVSSFQTYTIFEGELIDSGQNIRKGPQQMLIEGFTDLTSGDTNCVLNQAIFEVDVVLSGVSLLTTATTFYTGTSLNDFPGDDDYYYTLRSLLLSFSGISDVIIEPVENKITIGTIPNPPAEYIDVDVIVGIKIYYDISCEDTSPPVLAPFIFDIDTTLTSMGSSANDKFQLPLDSTGNYDFIVDWGDGSTDTINTWNDPLTEHTYSSTGIYTIQIFNQLSGWTFNNGGDRDKILSVQQWGIFEPGNVTGHFYGCSNLDLSSVSDVPNLTTTNNLQSTFRDCTSLTTINNSQYWDTSTITSLSSTFRDSVSFDGDLNSWDVSNVTTMNSTFRGVTAFDQPLNNWNTSACTDTTRMFLGATGFNQDISSWDMSNNIQMGAMFQNATSFNQDIDIWDVSNVTNMNGTFDGASAFNQPLNTWNTSNVVLMNGLFANTTLFNQPLNNWDTSGVTTMQGMFESAIAFNQNLNSWNVSSVTNMSAMFESASVFNQPVNNWDVSSVTNMMDMFNSASNFNQALDSWDVSNVSAMDNMLDNCGMNQTNYQTLLIAWNTLPILQFGVTFGVQGLQYQIGSIADTSRSNIIAVYSWTIVGDTAVP
jgi:surface protein